MASPFVGVDHVAIVVRSIDRSLAHYVTTLGFPLIHDEVLADPPVRLAYVDCGNVFLQLVEPLGVGAAADVLETQGEGFFHLCFEVGEIEAAIEEFGTSPRIFMGGRGRRACFMTERPDGVFTELTESEPRGPTGA